MLYASELSGCQKKDCQMNFQAMDYVELLKLKEQLDAEIKHRESEGKAQGPQARFLIWQKPMVWN